MKTHPDYYTRDHVGVGRLTVGDRGRLAKPILPVCCKNVIPEGALVEVYARYSKKRVILHVLDSPDGRFINSLHKVRASRVWFQ